MQQYTLPSDLCETVQELETTLAEHTKKMRDARDMLDDTRAKYQGAKARTGVVTRLFGSILGGTQDMREEKELGVRIPTLEKRIEEITRECAGAEQRITATIKQYLLENDTTCAGLDAYKGRLDAAVTAAKGYVNAADAALAIVLYAAMDNTCNDPHKDSKFPLKDFVNSSENKEKIRAARSSADTLVRAVEEYNDYIRQHPQPGAQGFTNGYGRDDTRSADTILENLPFAYPFETQDISDARTQLRHHKQTVDIALARLQEVQNGIDTSLQRKIVAIRKQCRQAEQAVVKDQ